MTQPLDRRLVTEEKANATYVRPTDAAITGKLSKTEAQSTFSPPDRSSVVLIGDSRINLETSSASVVSEPLTVQTTGAFNWANNALRHRFRVLNYAGIVGNTSAQVLARYATDCLAFKPGIVVIGVGVNDVSGNVELATIKANLMSMIEQNRSIGARTVLLTVSPKNDHTAAQRLVLAQLNRWILRLGDTGNVFPADVTSPIVANTGMTWAPACSSDGLHQNKVGAARQGRALAKVLEKLAPPADPLPQYNADPLNAITNGLFDGTLGGLPSGFQVFPTESTRTLVARTDQQPGNWLQIESPTQVNNTVANGSSPQALPASWVPGTTKVFGVIEMESEPWTAVAHTGPNLSLQFDAGGSPTHYVIGNAHSAGDTAAGFPLENQPGLNGPIVIKTPEFTVPAGTTRFRLIAGCNFQGKIRWSRMAVYAV